MGGLVLGQDIPGSRNTYISEDAVQARHTAGHNHMQDRYCQPCLCLGQRLGRDAVKRSIVRQTRIAILTISGNVSPLRLLGIRSLRFIEHKLVKDRQLLRVHHDWDLVSTSATLYRPLHKQCCTNNLKSFYSKQVKIVNP